MSGEFWFSGTDRIVWECEVLDVDPISLRYGAGGFSSHKCAVHGVHVP